LEYLHDHELIHLDLKPENILTDADEHYMAPEILEGMYSKAADVFSFGLILLELATNVQLPPHGDSWQYLRHGDFSELSFEDTSDALTQMIKEMTHPEPVLRPSIEKVKRRVEFFLNKYRKGSW
jgi:mitosis inhibitor protein kinase SWE1